MNAQRRKTLRNLVAKIEEVINDLDYVQEEEQEAFDNMPESFQDGERGEKMQEGIDTMDDIRQSLEEAVEWLNDIIE